MVQHVDVGGTHEQEATSTTNTLLANLLIRWLLHPPLTQPSPHTASLLCNRSPVQWSAVAVISRSRISPPPFLPFHPFFPDIVKFCPLWWVKAMIAEAPLQSTPAVSTPGQAIRCYSSWQATNLKRKFRKTKKFYWATCDPVTVSVSGCATWSLGPSPDQRPGPGCLLLKTKANCQCWVLSWFYLQYLQ